MKEQDFGYKNDKSQSLLIEGADFAIEGFGGAIDTLKETYDD